MGPLGHQSKGSPSLWDKSCSPSSPSSLPPFLSWPSARHPLRTCSFSPELSPGQIPLCFPGPSSVCLRHWTCECRMVSLQFSCEIEARILLHPSCAVGVEKLSCEVGPQEPHCVKPMKPHFVHHTQPLSVHTLNVLDVVHGPHGLFTLLWGPTEKRVVIHKMRQDAEP